MFVHRAHSAFIDDCLDAFIVGACIHHLGMEDIGSEPKSNQVLFEAVSSEDKVQFIANIASEIQRKYINLENGMYIYGTCFFYEVNIRILYDEMHVIFYGNRN